MSASARTRSRKATSSRGLAIIEALLGLLVLPLPCSVAAIVQGVRARREIRSDPGLSGKYMALLGIVIGVLGLLFYVALFAALRLSSGFGGANTLA